MHSNSERFTIYSSNDTADDQALYVKVNARSRPSTGHQTSVLSDFNQALPAWTSQNYWLVHVLDGASADVERIQWK